MGRISIVWPCLKECLHGESASPAVQSFRSFVRWTVGSRYLLMYVTGSTRQGISRRNHLGFQKFQHVCMCKQTRCGLRNHDVKVGVTIWSKEWKMTIERKSVLWLDQLVRRSTAKRWLLCLCFSSSTKCYWAFTRWAAILWLLLNIHHDNRLMLPIS